MTALIKGNINNNPKALFILLLSYEDRWVCVDTLYSGEFERGGVEALDPLGLHRDVDFLQAVFLQQVVHLQEMLPKVLGQKLDLRWSRRRQRRVL